MVLTKTRTRLYECTNCDWKGYEAKLTLCTNCGGTYYECPICGKKTQEAERW
jgi:hypothetical protein